MTSRDKIHTTILRLGSYVAQYCTWSIKKILLVIVVDSLCLFSMKFSKLTIGAKLYSNI